jgi:hypothetical protein
MKYSFCSREMNSLFLAYITDFCMENVTFSNKKDNFNILRTTYSDIYEAPNSQTVIYDT